MSTRGAVSEVRLDAPPAGVESIELLCYAVNSVGRQDKPCVVVVVLASVPQPPAECSLHNGTRGHLEVVCRPGNDGDLPQYFELEVRKQAVATPPREFPPLPSPATLSDQAQAATPTLEASAASMAAAPSAAEAAIGPPLHHFQSAQPHFELDLLQPDTYQLTVFAVNDKGRSEPPVVLTGVRISNALSRHLPLADRVDAPGSAKAAALQPTPIILAVVIAAAVLLLGGMVATAALLACRPQQQPRSPMSTLS